MSAPLDGVIQNSALRFAGDAGVSVVWAAARHHGHGSKGRTDCAHRFQMPRASCFASVLPPHSPPCTFLLCAIHNCVSRTLINVLAMRAQIAATVMLTFILVAGYFVAKYLRLDRLAQVRLPCWLVTVPISNDCARSRPVRHRLDVKPDMTPADPQSHRHVTTCFTNERRGIGMGISFSSATLCRYLSFIYYGYGLLLHVEYNHRTFYRCDMQAM